jgi:hypothetical protein
MGISGMVEIKKKSAENGRRGHRYNKYFLSVD